MNQSTISVAKIINKSSEFLDICGASTRNGSLVEILVAAEAPQHADEHPRMGDEPRDGHVAASSPSADEKAITSK